MKRNTNIKIAAVVAAVLLNGMFMAIFAQKPAISFTQKDYNFGMVSEKGGNVSCDFEFTNTGDAPLVIISATASCGCTRPSYPTEPIAPGEKGKIKVTYVPEGRPGEFVRMVKVRTNADNAKKVNLKITGSVYNPEK